MFGKALRKEVSCMYHRLVHPALRRISPLLCALLCGGTLSQVALATPVDAAPDLAPRQTLVKGNGAEPESLDPALVRSGFPGEVILVDLFEGLVSENGEGKIVPAQAMRWEQSPDGLEWRFFLRPNLHWSNGTPLKAEDFVYAWRRLLDPALASPSAGLMLATGINNAASIYAGALDLDSLGVVAEGDQILKVTLERPVPYFLQLISQRPFVPVPRQVIAEFGKGWTQPAHLVSNGAYRLTSWVMNERLEAERNPAYWDNGHTRIDRVTYLPLASQHAERLRYEAGEIQLTNRVAQDYYARIKATVPERLWGLPLLGTYLYSFNMNKPELQDVRVRQALSMVIDRQLLTDKVSAQGELPSWRLLPDMPGYTATTPELANASQDIRSAMAVKLLKEAGIDETHPLRLTLTYNSSENHKRMALAVASMWKPLGVEVELRNMEWNAYQLAKNSGDFMVARSFLFGDYVEPSAMLNALRCLDPQNESGYCNPHYDQLLEQAAATLDEQRRSHLYQQAERLIEQDVPVIPLYHYNQMRLVDPQLRGLPSSNLKGAIATKDLYFVTPSGAK
jgi:oligopeptide transport system substrate-binding protein